jgi:poly-gamma-glutamate synthesis protein (capsule biosynthesis protein)
MVVGHHHHAIRGMEWYRGRPIMYGLGHFAFDYQGTAEEAEQILDPDLQEYLRQINIPLDPNDAFGLPDYYRLTLVAWATADRDGVRAIGFLPCKLATNGSINPLRLGTSDSDEVIRHFERCNLSQGLGSGVTSEGTLRLAGFDTVRVVSR